VAKRASPLANETGVPLCLGLFLRCLLPVGGCQIKVGGKCHMWVWSTMGGGTSKHRLDMTFPGFWEAAGIQAAIEPTLRLGWIPRLVNSFLVCLCCRRSTSYRRGRNISPCLYFLIMGTLKFPFWVWARVPQLSSGYDSTIKLQRCCRPMSQCHNNTISQHDCFETQVVISWFAYGKFHKGAQ